MRLAARAFEFAACIYGGFFAATYAGAVGAFGAHRRADRLEVHECTADIGRCGRPGLQHHADHVGGALSRRLVDHRAPDVAAAHGDQAVRLEQVDGLAQRGWADAELAEQALLTRQYVALLEPAGQDVVTQAGGDQFGHPGGTNPLHRHPFRLLHRAFPC